MCGGRGHPPTAPSGRAVFLRGVETGGRGRRVDGDPRGLVAGRAQDRHGRRRVRVVRGHEGVLTEEDGEVCARGGCGGVGCGDAAGAEGDGDAGGCRGLEGGNGTGGIAVAGVKVSCGRSSRTVSRQISGRCAFVRMVATAGSSAACRLVLPAAQGQLERRAAPPVHPGPEAAEARALHFAGFGASGGRARPRP